LGEEREEEKEERGEADVKTVGLRASGGRKRKTFFFV
jgi:hypothetical protein